MVFAGSCTVNAGTGNDLFNAFVEYELVPNLKHGDIVVMDNLSSHKNAEVIAMIHKSRGRGMVYAAVLSGVQPHRKGLG